MKNFIVILTVIPAILAAHLHLNEITPEEAQKYFAEQSLDINYGHKLSEIPLAQVRSYTGRDFYYNGRKIEHPEDYVEETYEAQQFHGQDGLGRAMFGYTDYNQARLEARNVNGDVRGSYQYVDPTGENVIVQYWSDQLGFHQTDNMPKIVLETITDTPEVQAAREEHERAWQEAAEAAKANPDPMSDVYNRAAIAYDNSQLEAESAAASESVSNQAQGLQRYPNLGYDEHIKPQRNSALHDENDAVIIEAVAESQVSERKQKSNDKDSEIEIPSVPRGFFYKFEYPVYLIQELEMKRALKKEQESSNKVRRHDTASEGRSAKTEGSAKVDIIETPKVKTTTEEKRPIDALKTVSEEKVSVAASEKVESVKKLTEPKVPAPIVVKTELKAESPQISRVSLKATQEGAIPLDAVHDVQVHPNQKAGLVDSQRSPVAVHSD